MKAPPEVRKISVLAVDSDEENILQTMDEVDEGLADILKSSRVKDARHALYIFKQAYDFAWQTNSDLEDAIKSLRRYHAANLHDYKERVIMNRKFTFIAKEQYDDSIPPVLFAAWDTERQQIDGKLEPSHKVKRLKMMQVGNKIELTKAKIEMHEYITERYLVSLDSKCQWIREALSKGDILTQPEPDMHCMVDFKKYKIPVKEPNFAIESAILQHKASRKDIPMTVLNCSSEEFFSNSSGKSNLLVKVKEGKYDDFVNYMPWNFHATIQMKFTDLYLEIRPGRKYSSLTIKGQKMIRRLVYNQFLILLAYNHDRILGDISIYQQLNIDPEIIINIYKYYTLHFSSIPEARKEVDSIVLFLEARTPEDHEYLQNLLQRIS